VGGIAVFDEYMNGSNHKVKYRRVIKGKPKDRGLLWYVMCSSVQFFDKDGNHIKGDNLYIPHTFALYTADECWRRVCGPRGGRGHPPLEWRGYGEGGCFLLDSIKVLTASKALKPGTTIIGDRLFSSFHLLKKLSAWGLYYIGTMKKNTKGVPQMQSQDDERGSSVYRMCTSMAKTICGWWRDSTWVLIVTFGWPWKNAEHEVSRKQRGHRAPVRVKCPLPASVYNMYMGAVDFFNREALTTYRGQLKCFRVWKHIFFTLFFIWVYAAYCHFVFAKNTCLDEAGKAVYKKLGVSGNKEFRLRLAKELASEQKAHYARSKKHRKRTLTQISDVGLTVDEMLQHTAIPIRAMPKWRGRRAECIWCRTKLRGKGKKKHSKTSTFGCAECQVGLHTGKCFILYHERLFAKPSCSREDEPSDEESQSGESTV
jgi:hypothetical protein